MSTWVTRSAELVGVGDMVALSVLGHADAVGRIVGEAEDGQVRCALTCHGCMPGQVVVGEDQLLLRMARVLSAWVP